MDMDILKTVENLKAKGFKTFLVKIASQACNLVEKLIEEGAEIGFGGSVTIEDMGLLDKLSASSKNITLYHRGLMDEQGVEKSLQFELIHKAPWFASSANAITENGEIINVDGRGNRVAKTLFGTRHYICIAGVNKIVENIEKGLERVRTIAAPLNIKKLNRTTPCLDGKPCAGCANVDNICRATVIHHLPPSGIDNFFVILINQSLGF